MNRILVSDDGKKFFVGTKTVDFEGEPVLWGRLVDETGAGQELPFMSINNHMPYTQWSDYKGDPAPILQRLKGA